MQDGHSELKTRQRTQASKNSEFINTNLTLKHVKESSLSRKESTIVRCNKLWKRKYTTSEGQYIVKAVDK